MLFDTNIWLALTFTSHPHHRLAKKRFGQASKKQPACFCRATQQSFLRLSSTPALQRIYGAEGFTNEDAASLLGMLSGLSSVGFLAEPPDVFPLWQKLASLPSASPKVWMDAYLAALAILHQAEFHTFDQDFRNYEKCGLKLQLISA